MDHHPIITAKVRTRRQFPGKTLRDMQMLEAIYGVSPIEIDVAPALARNKAGSDNFYFPLQSMVLPIKK